MRVAEIQGFLSGVMTLFGNRQLFTRDVRVVLADLLERSRFSRETHRPMCAEAWPLRPSSVWVGVHYLLEVTLRSCSETTKLQSFAGQSTACRRMHLKTFVEISSVRSLWFTQQVMLPAMAEAPVLSEVKTSILLTAMDVPVQDSTVHDVGRCRMVTVQHVDCGLIW